MQDDAAGDIGRHGNAVPGPVVLGRRRQNVKERVMTRVEAILMLAMMKKAYENMPKLLKRLDAKLADKRVEALTIAIYALADAELRSGKMRGGKK